MAGAITDATGAVLQHVAVVATDVESGRTWSTTTNTAGSFSFPALPPARYRLTATAPGFKTFTAHDLRLELSQFLRLDVTMEVGTLAERIDVSPGAPLRTDSVEVGLVVSSQEASAYPSIGRNYLPLAFLTPGVVTVNPSLFGTGLRSTTGGRPYVNGNRKEQNTFLLDGVDNNQTTDNLTAYQPSPDAIQEVQIVTNNAQAEFGNYQGGIFNVALKSGTNQFHGTVFAFVRDEVLNATNWAANSAAVDPLHPARKPPYRYDILGGSAGGPIIQDRLFFFGDYQRTRKSTEPATSLVTLIAPAMRRGDFSSLLQGSNPQQLYDPLTTRPDPSNPGAWLRDPFRGNQIPLDRLNPVAAALFSSPFYPEPTVPDSVLNYRNGRWTTIDNDQFDIKVDGKLTSRDDLSARYMQGLQNFGTVNEMPILLAFMNRSPVAAAALHWTRQVSSSLVNEARMGFNRIVIVADGAVDEGGIGDLGETLGIQGANETGPGLPLLTFAAQALTLGGNKVVQDWECNTYQYQDTLTWHRGQHLVKTGLLALRYQQNVYFSGNFGQLGVFDFSGQYTRNLADPRSTGSPVADFFLGYPTRVARGDYAGTWGHRSTLWAGFLQDDWRVSRRVTLNLGLRYEYRTPFVEVHDRQVNFDLDTGRPLYAGVDGNSRALYKGYGNDWQPRVGVAWTPARWDDRLVVRGAYGISSFLEGTGTNLRLTLNPPFFNEFEQVNSDPAVLGTTVDEGFARVPAKDPLAGSVLRAWDPAHRPARSQQWTVAVESRITGETTLTLGYVGQRGSHLVVPVNFNQREFPNGPRPWDHVYPQISSVILTSPEGASRYDALQAMVRRRLGGGWSGLVSYTWSHAMTDGRGFFSESGLTAEQAAFWANPRDPDAEWGPAPFDAQHVLNGGLIVELPWGRSRRWLHDAPTWLEAIVGGWSMAGIMRANTGFAITVLAPDQSQTGARTGRPDRIGSGEGTREVGLGGSWFDTSAFVLPALGTFGNAGVGVIRGPGLRVIDLCLSKVVGLPGRFDLEFRAEAFNLLNTPVFNAPDRSLTSATFGKVTGSQLEREIQLGLKLRF